MKTIQEQLEEEILLLTDKRLEYVLKRVEDLLSEEETEKGGKQKWVSRKK